MGYECNPCITPVKPLFKRQKPVDQELLGQNESNGMAGLAERSLKIMGAGCQHGCHTEKALTSQRVAKEHLAERENSSNAQPFRRSDVGALRNGGKWAAQSAATSPASLPTTGVRH